ncbi:MAG: IS607 family transposase, partial [Thermoplasmata archaeon]
MDKLYRLGEAAKILGVSVSTLRRWDMEGRI